MAQFKVGDKVRVNTEDIEVSSDFEHIGKIGVVSSVIDDELVIVDFNDRYTYAIWVAHLEKVED